MLRHRVAWLAGSLLWLGLGIGQPARAALIGVDLGTGTGTPASWNTYGFADVGTTIAGLVDEEGNATAVTFLAQAPVGNLVNTPASPGVLPSHPNPLDAICCDALYGGINPMAITFGGLVPGATYDYWIVSSSVWNDGVTVIGATTDAFASPATAFDSQAINGIPGSSASTFQSYARQIAASAAGTILFYYSSGGTPVVSAAAVQLVPEPGTALLLLAGIAGIAANRRSCA